MAAKPKPISQSDTKWVKKPGQRGYVVQISTGKRVTGKVKLVKGTTKGSAGQTQRYSKGVGKNLPAANAGGGQRPGQRPDRGGGSGRTTPTRTGTGDGATPKPPAKFNEGDRRRGPNGNMNVYRNGKWVPTAASARQRAQAASGRNRPAGSSAGNQPPKPPARPSNVTPSNYTGFSVNKPGSKPAPGNGSPAAYVREWVANLGKPTSTASGAVRRTRGPDGRTYMARWDGKNWVRI